MDVPPGGVSEGRFAAAPYSSQIVARPKKAKKPTTSVTQVTNTPEAGAGSKRNQLSVRGIRIPASAAANRLTIRAAAITTPSNPEPNQTNTSVAKIRERTRPLTTPTTVSRVM